MIKMKLHLKMAEKRITQSELSNITGIRQPTISAYYNDTWKTISKEHLDTLCDFFNCKIEDLIEQIPTLNRQSTIYDYIEGDKKD
ncbi:helix-turn-helix domain-containing protein [Clostridium estertheticum]|uniref:Helix-turn-helix transcriptional regulator n=1 Tax=Clostridium estertheticum TaxID=238834 RepID=A0AA47EJD1_9CLOT|nr:helix-turn-helix transcriptional regulator [Clostridium estertheticum]MBU3153924.1 helix-turn-helix transcriptional regulator [Clostridium estertheticum]WAG61302.1 helix-turn-helix transcriptional regulator [Clostridium estertheticum]